MRCVSASSSSEHVSSNQNLEALNSLCVYISSDSLVFNPVLYSMCLMFIMSHMYRCSNMFVFDGRDAAYITGSHAYLTISSVSLDIIRVNRLHASLHLLTLRFQSL